MAVIRIDRENFLPYCSIVSVKTKKPDSVTVTDVAQRAGVSVGTVSRVLNNKPNISADNLARVQQAITELGYKKCQSAELLVSRRKGSRVRAGNIGMVFSGISSNWASHPLISAYTLGVEKACREKGFHVMIELCGDETTAPRCVAEGKIDGLIVKATRHIPAFAKQLPPQFPIIALGTMDPDTEIHQVAMDNQGAGWTVAHSLWECGHRRIGFACIDSTHPMLLGRFHGYESFMRQNKAFHPEWVVMRELEVQSYDPEERPPDTTSLVAQLLAGNQAQWPTAIIAANDWMACGLYATLQKMGVGIPDPISIVAFDNTPGLCNSLVPGLTSYDMSFDAVAYVAAMELFDRICEPQKPRESSIQLVRGKLVERQSVRSVS
jgi:LacI family transcriptional regulator